MCDSADLVTLVPILSIIRDQIDERHEVIGNWLYCLRNESTGTEPKSKIILPVEDDHSFPSKQRRLGADGRMGKKHASAQSGDAADGAIGGAKDRVFGLHNATSTVEERSPLDHSYVERWASESHTLDLVSQAMYETGS